MVVFVDAKEHNCIIRNFAELSFVTDREKVQFMLISLFNLKNFDHITSCKS